MRLRMTWGWWGTRNYVRQSLALLNTPLGGCDHLLSILAQVQKKVTCLFVKSSFPISSLQKIFLANEVYCRIISESQIKHCNHTGINWSMLKQIRIRCSSQRYPWERGSCRVNSDPCHLANIGPLVRIRIIIHNIFQFIWSYILSPCNKYLNIESICAGAVTC